MLLIDIHTHKSTSAGISIVNHHENFNSVSGNEICSLGLHPNYLNLENVFEVFSSLKENTKKKSVVAIGECGLDWLCETDILIQEKYFRLQLSLAQGLIKPVIIHCVRAHELVLKIIQEMGITIPVIFHGFNKKYEIAEKIIQRNHYLSYGTSLLKNPNAVISFQRTPIDLIFLETDNADVDIYKIYETAARLRNMRIEDFISQIHQNAALVFGARIFAI